MNEIWQIALNTLKEAVRDKILYIVVSAGFSLVLFSLLIGDWAVFNQSYVVQSLSFSLLSFSGLAIAIFVGIGMIQKEIQKKTLLTLLAKPISRGQFILGKYLGLCLLMLIHVSLMLLMILFVLWVGEYPISGTTFAAAYLAFLELILITAVAVLFSSFSTPVLSSLFTFGVFLAGSLSSELMRHLEFVKKTNELQNQMGEGSSVLEFVSNSVYFLFPNLGQYNVTQNLVHKIPLESGYLLGSSLNSMGYIFFFISLSIWWFSRRDFV